VQGLLVSAYLSAREAGFNSRLSNILAVAGLIPLSMVGASRCVVRRWRSPNGPPSPRLSCALSQLPPEVGGGSPPAGERVGGWALDPTLLALCTSGVGDLLFLCFALLKQKV
jgi:hypothetical protein